MYIITCKECGKVFENKHSNQKYCSIKCFTSARRKINDLTGRKFGRLTVTKFIKSENKYTIFECKCECGNIIYANRDDLTSMHKQSCGCLRKELAKKNFDKKFGEFIKNNYVENTSLSQLKANFKNNKSGQKGVCWDKKNNNWRASIEFQHKRHYLGSFKKIEDAVAARKAAEEKYFKPILDKYKGSN